MLALSPLKTLAKSKALFYYSRYFNLSHTSREHFYSNQIFLISGDGFLSVRVFIVSSASVGKRQLAHGAFEEFSSRWQR